MVDEDGEKANHFAASRMKHTYLKAHGRLETQCNTVRTPS
jgi:hypothetical protein